MRAVRPANPKSITISDCGTFGRVGSSEGQWALKGGGLTSFSEEMLVDCIGWDKDQFSFFSPKGFMTTGDYPYLRVQWERGVPHW